MFCAKCRQCEPTGTDSWCIACTGVETLTAELRARWSTPALPAIANELIVSAVRGVTALREISSSWDSAGRSRAAGPPGDSHRGLSPRGRERSLEDRGSRRSRGASVKQQAESSEDEEEEEEEPVRRSPSFRGATAKADPARKPPEPPHSPRGHREHHHHSSEKSKRKRSEDKRDRHRGKDKPRKRGNRAGFHHQRLYRTLEDPDLKVHRRPPKSYWSVGRPLAGHRPHSDRR